MIKIGDHVRLLNTNDTHTKLSSGDEGVVKSIDSLGTIGVDWSKGGNLCLIEGDKNYEVIGGKKK